MAAGDNTADNRWRPDSAASQRRVREEQADEARDGVSIDALPTVYSRELSFVPNNRRHVMETGNAETRALIRRYAELDALPNGEQIRQRLDEWKWPWAQRSAADKQRFLEPLIASVRRDRTANEDALVFLLIVFEPTRRGVSAAFRRARAGLEPALRDVSFTNRAETKNLRYIERERLEDVTRTGVLSAILNYPGKPPRSLFGWLRETIAHRALDELRGELPEIAERLDAPEAQATAVFLDLLPNLDVPALDGEVGMRRQLHFTDVRRLYGVVDEFYDHEPIREACLGAIDRLPRRQGQVIEALYLHEIKAATLATSRKVSRSTIDNHHAQAKVTMAADDGFFLRLSALGIVRDAARAADIQRRYPEGRMPDGRRRIVITDAA